MDQQWRTNARSLIAQRDRLRVIAGDEHGQSRIEAWASGYAEGLNVALAVIAGEHGFRDREALEADVLAQGAAGSSNPFAAIDERLATGRELPGWHRPGVAGGCPISSSITGQPCELGRDHPRWSDIRFHKYSPLPRSAMGETDPPAPDTAPEPEPMGSWEPRS